MDSLGLYVSGPTGLYVSGATGPLKVVGEVAGELRSPVLAGCSGQLGTAKMTQRAGNMGQGKGTSPVWFKRLSSDKDGGES